MALKQFIVPLDDTVEGLGALRFVLRNFGFEKNIVNILRTFRLLGASRLFTREKTRFSNDIVRVIKC